MTSLFSYQGDNCHIIYKNIRHSEKDIPQKIKTNSERLWNRYAAEVVNINTDEFLREFRLQPDQRYWEMYLGNCLLNLGLNIQTHNPGPDFSFLLDNKTAFIEAIVPTSGADGHPDSIPEPEYGVCRKVPIGKILLRFQSAFQEKVRKFRGYASNKTAGVSGKDIKIVAISSSALRGVPDSGTLPYIISALFGVGNPYVSFDKKTGNIVEEGYQPRFSVQKESGSDIQMHPFAVPDFSDISGVLYGRSDIGNPPTKDGADLMVIHNPFATNPLPKEVLHFSREYWVEEKNGMWELQNIEYQ